MKRITPFALIALVAVGACADHAPVEPTLGVDDPVFNRQNAPGQQRLAGLDAEFAQMAREVPGFGGMFYDEAGNLNVFMANGRAAEQAGAAQGRQGRGQDARGQDVRAQVSQSMRARGRDVPAPERIVLREADYDFTELADHYQRMLPVLGVPGVVFTDIDETQNRLKVGFQESVPEDRVRHSLEMLGVPLELVILEVAEPIEPLSDHSLQNRQQPLAGGLQLIMHHPDPRFVSICTLGFNVLLDGPGRSEPYFMTNSHCTDTRGQATGTRFYQQSVAVPDPRYLIGIEAIDPPFFDSPCFVGFICRWSDAALVRYETRRTPVNFGAIYRTEFFGTGNNVGSLVVDQQGNPKFFTIRGEEPVPLIGEVLDKVGRTTGWTRGPVTQTCFATTPGPPIAYLCQDRVQAMVGAGDSGSPVFQQIDDSKNAILYGILWGGSVVGGMQTYVFSALENIRLDMGDFRTH